MTLDHHLTMDHRVKLGETAGFCANPDCEMIYFNDTAAIRKGETLLPVTQKDRGDDVYVCYCFAIKRFDIRRDLAARGITDIPERIKQGLAEGQCECEKKNPQGACCLGNVLAEIGRIKAEVKKHDEN